MKVCELALIEEKLEIINNIFGRNLTSDMFIFFTEGFSKTEQRIISNDLKSRGICTDYGMEEFRQDLVKLIENIDNEDINLEPISIRILKAKWKLYDIHKPLTRPLARGEVCDEIHMQPMDYNCGGYESVNLKVLRFFKEKKNKDFTVLFIRHGVYVRR